MSPETSPNALVPTTPAATRLASITSSPLERLLDSLQVIWSSVPLSSPECRALLAAMTGECSVLEDDRFGDSFDIIAAMVCGPRGSDPATGEVWTSPTTYLLCADGHTMSHSSPFVADCLAVATMDREQGRWDPPLRLEALKIRGRNGHARTILREVVSETTPAPKKGGKRG